MLTLESWCKTEARVEGPAKRWKDHKTGRARGTPLRGAGSGEAASVRDAVDVTAYN